MNTSDIKNMIKSEASAAGLNPDVFLMFASIETGGTFNPRSYNSGSGASGLFQFVPKNLSAYGLTPATAFDPVANTRAAIKLYKENYTAYTKKFGRAPEAWESYAMHQQGFGGFSYLLENASKRISDLSPKTQVNVVKNGGTRSQTAGQFLQMWKNKANARMGGAASSSSSDIPILGGSNGTVTARFRGGEMKDFEFNPIPWDEALQAKYRIKNISKDMSIGIQKLIPTYKIYVVYSNNENHIERLIDENINPKYYEIPAVRNIHIELASQDNPVSVAYFEVLNSNNTAANPADINPVDRRSARTDIFALGSGYENLIMYDQIKLQAGNNIQIRLGYGNDPNKLVTVFNGVISESSGGEIIEVTAEGYGRELQNEILIEKENSWFNQTFSEKYISESIGIIIKNINTEHFGKTPKFLSSMKQNMNSSLRGTEDQGGINEANFNPFTNKFFGLGDGQLFFFDYMGPSDTLENFYIANLDIVSMYWGEGSIADALPFSTRNFFQSFRVTNKTPWEALTSARRCFPSSIQLVKNMGARSTLFAGIKEQNMLVRPVENSLIKATINNYGRTDYETDSEIVKKQEQLLNDSKVAQTVLDKSKQKGGIEGFIEGVGAIFAQQNADQQRANLNAVSVITPSKTTIATAKQITEESKKKSPVTNDKLANIAKEFLSVPDSAWGAATNFHILSSSYNIISNQMRLNASAYTSVSVEYGTKVELFGSGANSTFDLAANGNLFPASIKTRMHSDSTVESENMALRTAQSVIIEELERMYDGVIIVTGNPLISPGDYASINDVGRNMTGVIKCREVQHVFTEQDGFITIITPGMFVEPATHLYSLLYQKLAIFSTFIQETITNNKILSVGTGGIAGVFTSAIMSDQLVSSNEIFAEALAFATTGAMTARASITLGSGVASSLLRAMTGSSSIMGTSRAAVTAGGAALNTLRTFALSNNALKTLRATKTISSVFRVITFGRTAISGGSALLMTPAAPVAVIGILVTSMIGNFIESWMTKRILKHKPVLKFPVMVNGREYIGGLYGWNDDKGIFEQEWENIKKSAKNLGIINDVASEAYRKNGIGSVARIGWEIISD